MQTHVRFNALGRLSRWVMLPVLLAAALGSAPLSTAHAIGSIITVDTLAGDFADDAGTGDCSLAEAIDNANNDGGGTPRSGLRRWVQAMTTSSSAFRARSR